MVTKMISSRIDIRTPLRLVYQHAVYSVNPSNLLQKELIFSDGILTVRDKKYNLSRNLYLVGFGKAVLGMAYQADLILGDHLKKGIISIPIGQKEMFKQFSFKENSVINVFEGAKNNRPDENSLNAAQQIAELVKNLVEGDILITLVSGGGSALLPLPVEPLTVQEVRTVVKLLSDSGADITELNCVRKRLSVLKGGGLVNLAYPAQVISFILSDIVGDPLDFIASGPTVNNVDSPESPKIIFEKYSLLDKIPPSVKKVIEQPVNINQNKTDVQNVLIGSNKIALEGALKEVGKHNYNGFILTDILEGLVSDIFIYYIDFVLAVCKAVNDNISKQEFINQTQTLKKNLKIYDNTFIQLVDSVFDSKLKKICLLFGGEPTVKVTGTTGKGGRSQQLALHFSVGLKNIINDNPFMENFSVGLLCGGTDGMDGPTDAAGAIAYSGQLKSVVEQGLDPDTFIQNCDAYTFFSKLNNGEDLLKIGHTGTNVMDIHILLIDYIKKL